MSKKKVITIVFASLILATIALFLWAAIDTYNYEIKKYDIFEGLGAIYVVFIGGLVVIYEFDLFYTINYFVTKKKHLPESVLNILVNFCWLMFIAYIFFGVKLESIFGDVSFLSLFLVIAIALRIIYIFVVTVRDIASTSSCK